MAPWMVRPAATVRTFATSELPASSTLGAGRDAGIDVSTSHFVRVSASGTLTTRYGPCGRYFTPSGCSGLQGTLMAAFANAGGRQISGWFEVGTLVTLPVPFGAQRMLLRINGVSGREVGSYHVVADGVQTSSISAMGSAASASAATAGAGESAAQRARAGSPISGPSMVSMNSLSASNAGHAAGRVTIDAAGTRSPGSGPTLRDAPPGLQRFTGTGLVLVYSRWRFGVGRESDRLHGHQRFDAPQLRLRDADPHRK
jgi:hypothetical protein